MRSARETYPGAFHHVMNRGNNKQATFLDVSDLDYFCRLLETASHRSETEVHCYCLMGNHFHFILRNTNSDMDKFMHWVTGQYAQTFNRKYKEDGPVFKDRYKSKLIETDSYLVTAAKYIHNNPLAFTAIRNLPNYKYSSYQTYLGLRTSSWVQTSMLGPLLRTDLQLGGELSQDGLYSKDPAQLMVDLNLMLDQEAFRPLDRYTLEALLFVASPNLCLFDHLQPNSRKRKHRDSHMRLKKLYGDEESARMVSYVRGFLSNTGSLASA